MVESRVKKSFLNARVNVFFYCVTLILSFFSRKLFLDMLGANFVGLTGTLQNLLGFLNLAELGIGTSIGYVLYKPLYEKNERKINEIISVFGYLYRKIGLFILIVGFLLSCFLMLIFKNTVFSFPLIYFTFYGFLLSSLFGYFVNYRQVLLGADQRNYIVTGYYQSIIIMKTLVQMAAAYYTQNYYLWVIIELFFNIIYSFILNWRIDKEYPWLRSSIVLGKEKYPENKIILTKAKQLFVHVLAGTARNQFLPFLVYAFVSLKAVAYYGNYMLIISKVNMLVNNFLGSTGAGVGSLIAENDTKKIQRVFWELTSLRFIIAGLLTFALYSLINPFIAIWLGKDYILSDTVRIIILGNFFISQFRGTNDQFIFGYGLFHDTWAPVVTLLITLVVALIGGYLWGLPGVLLGDIASSITIISIWKPYFLYKEGFHLPVRLYWFHIFKYGVVLILAWIGTWLITTFLPFAVDPTHSYGKWILYAFYQVSLFSILLVASMFVISQGIRDLWARFIHKR